MGRIYPSCIQYYTLYEVVPSEQVCRNSALFTLLASSFFTHLFLYITGRLFMLQLNMVSNMAQGPLVKTGSISLNLYFYLVHQLCEARCETCLKDF